jgi:transposase
MPQPYRSQVLDHLGLVAGMFDELGIGAVIDHATRHNPETRLVTVGNAVKAMVLNGLGVVHQQLYLVPLFFQHKPTHRLIAPEIEAPHLNDDTLGRALDPLYDYGVTDLYSLVAVTAVQRLGLISRFAQLDSPSFHVDGRDNRAEEPDAHVIHITRGDSRDHRPDLTQVMLDLLVEHQAGIPLLMKPLSGHTSDAHDFGDVVTAHMAQRQTTDGTSDLGADSALYSEETLAKLAHTGSRWLTRVPATLTEAPHALVQATPATMIPLRASYRDQVLASTAGGVAQRWLLSYSEHRRPQAQRTVDKPRLKQGTAEVNACQKLCRTTFAGAADAQQALNTFAHSRRATAVLEVTVRATPRDHKRGRPGQGPSPAQVGSQIEGALASSIAAREALVAQQSCFILATNELEDTQVSAQAVLEG